MSEEDQEPKEIRVRGKLSADGLEGDLKLQGFDRVINYLTPTPVERMEAAASRRVEKNIRAGRPMLDGCDEHTQDLVLGMFERERRKEQNLGAVTRIAQREFPSVKQRALPPASDGPSTDPAGDGPSTDPDWFTRFRSYASEVSLPQVQEIWGRILANEAATPGSFSIYSLEVLRRLDNASARAFDQLSAWVVNGGILANSHAAWDFYANHGVTHSDLQYLQDVGLLAPGFNTVSGIQLTPPGRYYFWFYADRVLRVEGNHVTCIQPLTRAGCELLDLTARYDSGFYHLLTRHLGGGDIACRLATGFDPENALSFETCPEPAPE